MPKCSIHSCFQRDKFSQITIFSFPPPTSSPAPSSIQRLAEWTLELQQLPARRTAVTRSRPAPGCLEGATVQRPESLSKPSPPMEHPACSLSSSPFLTAPKLPFLHPRSLESHLSSHLCLLYSTSSTIFINNKGGTSVSHLPTSFLVPASGSHRYAISWALSHPKRPKLTP